MMSKAELARKAGLSTLTIDRVEAGRPCRLDTKRKILLALGLRVSDKDRLFGGQLDAPALRSTASEVRGTTHAAMHHSGPDAEPDAGSRADSRAGNTAGSTARDTAKGEGTR